MNDLDYFIALETNPDRSAKEIFAEADMTRALDVQKKVVKVLEDSLKHIGVGPYRDWTIAALEHARKRLPEPSAVKRR